MRNVFFFILLCLTLFDISISSRLDCTFKIINYNELGDVYTCEALYSLNITTPDSIFILSSSGIHLDQKSSSDVQALIAVNKNIQYFPKGLDLIHKNLKAIDLQDNHFKELYEGDLKPFKDLVRLDLGRNDIEVLEDGIFNNNQNLEVISFYGNKIYHIDLHVFDSLNKLNYLVLTKNQCIDEMVIFDLSGVQKIIKDAKFMCKSSEFLKGRFLMQRRFGNIADSSNFKAQLESMEINLMNRISELKHVIEELKNKI